MADEKNNQKKEKFAVIRTGGKQYIVHEDETLDIELVDVEENQKIVFDDILLAKNGQKIIIGSPIAKNVKIEAKSLGEVKGDKQIIFKYKAKKNYRVKTGHRQHYTKVKIENIELK